MKITVYHGATVAVDAPSCSIGRPRLDFGQGFYVTDLKEQAIKWAKTIAEKRGEQPLLNIYRWTRMLSLLKPDARYSRLMTKTGSTLLLPTDRAKILLKISTI